jgi:hypothetical protein
MLQHKIGLVVDWYQSHVAGGGARVGVRGRGRVCRTAQTTVKAEIIRMYMACSAQISVGSGSQQLSYARQMPYFVERLSKIPGVFEIIRELPVRDANSCRLILKPGLLFINHTFYIRSWSFIAG